MNYVKFSKKNKVVVGTIEVYTSSMKWKEKYLPQRYDQYNYDLHAPKGDYFHGVALPSKDAPSTAFNGVIVFDLDTRGSDKKSVWKDVCDELNTLGCFKKKNVETKGESLHVWVKIDHDLQEMLVKSEKYRTSAKLRVTKDSSIDLIFGSKCVRTSSANQTEGYICKSKSKEINFDDLPYMSKEDLFNFINDEELFNHVDFTKKSVVATKIDIQELPMDLTKINVNDVLLEFFNVEKLELMDSYTEHTKNIPSLVVISALLKRNVLGDYYKLFGPNSKGRDSGLGRGYNSFDINKASSELIKYIRDGIIYVCVKNEEIIF